jgi:hypothetical protein
LPFCCLSVAKLSGLLRKLSFFNNSEVFLWTGQIN